MRYFFILLTSLFITIFVNAQTSVDSVKTIITTMFNAMRNGDESLFKSTFADSAILQTISRGKILTEPLDEFAQFVGKLKKDSADERITFETVKTDGPLAIAWTPYSFYFNGKFSHCGVNSFQLVRLNGLWKIQYIIDTRRRTDCNQLSL